LKTKLDIICSYEYYDIGICLQTMTTAGSISIVIQQCWVRQQEEKKAAPVNTVAACKLFRNGKPIASMDKRKNV
jgi:hypothetical protein